MKARAVKWMFEKTYNGYVWEMYIMWDGKLILCLTSWKEDVGEVDI